MNSLFDEEELAVAPSQASTSVEKIWQNCLQELQFYVEEKELNQWIRPLQAQLQGEVLMLLAPNNLWVRQINQTYLAAITNAVTQASAGMIKFVRVKLTSVDKEEKKEAKPNAKKSKAAGLQIVGSPLDPKYTFENFIKGRSNAMAYNACYELSKKTGKHDYGSVFIYGASGLGKTHLVQAVAHRYQKYGKSVCYFTKDKFFAETLEAFRKKQIDSFIGAIYKMDLLMIDDVHLINGQKSPKVLEIVMRLFNDFSEDKDKQVILVSDRKPSQLEDFDDRFLSRLSSALPLFIDPPDMEMRVQILEKKAVSLDLDLPKECAIFMAQSLPIGTRGLEGALKQVAMFSNLQNEPISLTSVKLAIKDTMQDRSRVLNAENIRDIVAEYYEVSSKDLMGKKRDRRIARPRQMAMALVRELTNKSFPEIGQIFGGRDHTTVMHACDKIRELRQSDPVVEQDHQSLRAMLEYV